MVEAPGFEPRLEEPKSSVLPLYYASMERTRGTLSGISHLREENRRTFDYASHSRAEHTIRELEVC